MYVLVAVSSKELIAYADAARLLQHALGSQAPELPTLLGMEFKHRSPKTIAEEYLERHGHPSLRRCVQARRRERRAVGKIPPHRKLVRTPKRLLGVSDPSLN